MDQSVKLAFKEWAVIMYEFEESHLLEQEN